MTRSRKRRPKIHARRPLGVTTGKARSDINVTPLVDVVLVLLIIFMVMTPSLLKQMELTVPEKADVQVATPTTADQIVVAISREGRVAINREPISESQLTARIH